MNAKQAVHTTRKRVVDSLDKLFAFLDLEQVRAFQRMYYTLFMGAALTLLIVPGADMGLVDNRLGPAYYWLWVWSMLIFPGFTLVGRHLYQRSAGLDLGAANSAYGAANMQLTGDFTVWILLSGFAGVMIEKEGLLHNVIITVLLIMCVLGGAMFTIRSVRRVIEVRKRLRKLKREQVVI